VAPISTDPDTAEVRDLLERIRSGEGETFGALFGSFGDDVARLCAHLMGSGPDAEDAANETFLRARRGIDAYHHARPFRTWLLSIAAHHCIDRLRRRSREEKIFSPTELDAESLPGNGPAPLGGELGAERRRSVTTAMDALPERYRAPLVLRYFAEQSYTEIAEALALSEAQVGMLLYRARRKLRDILCEGMRP
jgi:RNA polymerase sigma-70 factor (ECF subfamily)